MSFRWGRVRPTDKTVVLLWLLCLATLSAGGGATEWKKEHRVVLRCRPCETFGQPPRHLHRNDQEEQVTHWISGAVPWDASDDGPA